MTDLPHAPALGRLARLLGPLHVTGSFWFRIHRFGVRVLPEWAKVVAVALFTCFFFVALRRIRTAVASNLVPVLGRCGWWKRQRRIFATLYSFAWCLTERYEMLSIDAPFEFSVINREVLDAELVASRGLIFVTSHIGNWEVGVAGGSGILQRRVHLVRERELDPNAQAFIAKVLNERLGDRITTHFAADDVSLAITLRGALEAGDLVALQGDRPRAGGATLEAEVLGRAFHLPPGPLALARLTGTPLLPVYVLRRGRRTYDVMLRQPIRVDRTHDREADLRRATSELAVAIEWAIQKEPHQWFCFRELWSEG